MTVSSIKASVLYKEHEIGLETRDIEAPGTGEVQVQVKCTTLCGSDLHYYKHGRNGDFKVRQPLSLGHESAGIVTAVGPNVTNLKVGDKVALEVGQPCGDCKFCKSGKYNLCGNMKFRSSAKSFPHFQGTLQERINCSASWCYKLPESIPLEQGALLEPLAVALNAGTKARVFPGASVLIIGAGAIGLLCAAVAKISGATTIVIYDISQKRVDFALENGLATHGHVVIPKRGETIEEKLEIAQTIADDLLSINPDKGVPFDITFECTGVEQGVQAGLYATIAGGRFVFVGMGTPIQTLHLGPALIKEINMIGVFRYANNYAAGVKLLEAGAIPAIDKIITHKVKGLENVTEAFDIASKPQDSDGNLVIKVAIFA
ncbi:D-xylulose reductase XYL2 [Sugiyamaella lignohabitans]|uniref:D-xylulose reductase XYL2 n=1 Tax=Sugiyamaella lignohabitans TaxID=796027 RepID=A0A167D1Z5_9ASCO|nr:D-xylulose reductase XYL2 [Sugiyamaella lignohabitans]ANB12380.1 D-xylulose reductase XYL2 [Sugiyamaella lignohabitans]